MDDIQVAVVPAAGLGTRFLPGTKVLPKEIFPVVDRPVIEFCVDEATLAGIGQIVLVTSPGKELLLRHFSPAQTLEAHLEERGKLDLLKRVRAIGRGATFSEVIQDQPHGLGHAVLTARGLIGDRYFAALLPDDIFVAPEPVIGQMMAVHRELGCTVLAVRRVPIEAIGRYGSIRYSRNEGPVYDVEGLVEKPRPDEAPSDLAVMGRYVLSPRIFDALERTGRGAGGEIQLTDGIQNLLKDERVVALEYAADYFDVGTIPGFLKTAIAFGRADPAIREDLEEYLLRLLDSPADRPPPTG